MRWIAQFSCPHCGTQLPKPWWHCMPRRFGGEFCCGGCRRVSQFPLLRRMLALAAMLATALIGVPLAFRVLDIYGVWPPLVFAGFVLAMLAVVSIATLLSALICAGSAYLVPRDH